MLSNIIEALQLLANNKEKMLPEVKSHWLDALRSRQFRQTRNVLKDHTHAMCCLGVLRHVMDPIDNGGTSFLHSEQLRQAGLSSDAQSALSILNDLGNYSFLQIADVVEAYL